MALGFCWLFVIWSLVYCTCYIYQFKSKNQACSCSKMIWLVKSFCGKIKFMQSIMNVFFWNFWFWYFNSNFFPAVSDWYLLQSAYAAACFYRYQKNIFGIDIIRYTEKCFNRISVDVHCGILWIPILFTLLEKWYYFSSPNKSKTFTRAIALMQNALKWK